MGKKIIWTPKVLEPHIKKNPKRWCEQGQHIFKNYKVNPASKICIYCNKVEATTWQSTVS